MRDIVPPDMLPSSADKVTWIVAGGLCIDAREDPASARELLDALRRFGSAWAAGAAAILLLLLWFPTWRSSVWWTLRILNVLGAVAAIKLEDELKVGRARRPA